ncbi:pilus assembly FimT family protein [Deinococcus yavapaiensis]|uniref:Prepilin-type N-terminal cleavage/methylation domain-containing protein n=1 Tax=Deinococcus yavapaiensis KR-236 TaxID=694435 RepID=A0A318S789_9DEIO|nr:prepilin-type N-terminal cleavage/methylation domain-containing protein [Deinococcus yavapaiensis KR-236]
MEAPLNRHGFTLLELLLVISVVGVLAAIIATNVNRPRPDLFADSVRSAMQQSRFEAVRRNRFVVFAWDGASNAFVVRVKNPTSGTSTVCASESSDTSLSSLSASSFPGLTVTTTFSAVSSLNGFVWQPSGLPVTCSTSGTSTTLASGSFSMARSGTDSAASTRTVVLSRAGGVTRQ